MPIRKNDYKSPIRRVITRRISPKEELPLETDNFTHFVDFLGQTMPSSEQPNFGRGARYAKKIIGNFMPDGWEVTDKTISSFIAELMHNARDYARQRQYHYSFLETLEKKDGKRILQLSVPYHSSETPDLAEHFNSFENPYVKLGAFTTLALSEKQQLLQQKTPIELRSDIAMHLQSA